MTDEKTNGRSQREERLAAALRENLKRRKQQIRARTGSGRAAEAPNSAGIASDKQTD